VPGGQLQGLAITRSQQGRFALPSALPNGTDSVDDKARRQTKAGRQPGFTGRTAAQSLAGGQQFGAGRPVNRPVDATTTEQRAVRRIDNGIDWQLRDVGLQDAQYGGHGQHRQLRSLPLN
jgi:hypothetical protein